MENSSAREELREGGRFLCAATTDAMIRYVERIQLKDRDIWEMVTEQFEDNVDDEDNGWRGEYWGKLMRGACVVYEYTRDKELYAILKDSTKRIIGYADSDGRISTYSIENEFHGWDIWSRKYVLLGLIHFSSICLDRELKKESIRAACAQLDYIISKIGRGKIDITDTSEIWGGINSSSILEPVVLLYNITGKKSYLEFADYIVENGGAKDFNIFEAAYEDRLYPYEYPVVKAYEIISCFEGLIEYYKVTGKEKWREAVIRFSRRVIASEITVIGSAGCRHELFNNSKLMQTYTGYSGLMQETCVTVTWIKFCFRMLKLTGENVYADEIERSVYNALYGAVNTNNCICGSEATFDEPYYRNVYDIYHRQHKYGQIFDSYSPLIKDIRGKAVGGFKPMRGKTAYFGCCIAIGAVGIGMVPKMSVLKNLKGFSFIMYIPGESEFLTEKGTRVKFIEKTEYPADGAVTVRIDISKSEEFEIRFRIPYFAKQFRIMINGKTTAPKIVGSTAVLNNNWSNGDIIDIEFDMNPRIVHGLENPDDASSSRHIAFMYGPLVLAVDKRLGECGTVFQNGADNIMFRRTEPVFESVIQGEIELEGQIIKVTDYSSAGKTWRRDSETVVWLKTEPKVN